jgi:tryptophanyl-tRNA synthetase
MVSSLSSALEPIRAKRKELEADMEKVKEIVAEGNVRARAICRETMAQVREAVGLRG